jgi:hypothetical protein
MKLGSVTATVLVAIYCLMATSCDIGGGGVQTPAQGEPSVIKGELWFEPLGKAVYHVLGDPCEVRRDSYDLRAGTPVVVKDVAGSTVATGELEPGVIVDLSFAVENGCRFDFTVEDVPVSAYYQIEIGDPAHTTASFSYDELESMNWTVRWGVGE